jgi:hypothetical protein
MAVECAVSRAVWGKFRMGSVPPAVLRGTVPGQHPGGFVSTGLEEIGADRLGQGRVVDEQGDELAGLLAGALPAGADLGAGVVTEVDAVENLWRI